MMSLLRKLHAWVGAALCLVVAVLAFSGAVLTYRPAWERATIPGADGAADLAPVALGRSMAAIEAEFGRERVTSVTFGTPDFGLHRVYFRGGGGAFVDGDGQVMDQWGPRGSLGDWLFELHRSLLSGTTGDQVVGWIGIALTAMTLSGLVLWWPARRSFRGKVAPGKGRAGWIAAHRDLGLMTAPLIVVLALTGSALELPNISRPLMNAPLPPAPPAEGVAPVDWARAIAVAQARFPEAVPRMAVQPPDGRAASVRMRQPQEWHANGRTILYLDPGDARLLQVVDAQAQGMGGRIFNAFWPIHAARVGGVLWELVVFLSGIALGVLSLYGAEAYRRKLFPAGRAKAAQPA